MNKAVEVRREFESFDSPNPKSPYVVMKFGGRSVASSDKWRAIAQLIEERIESGLIPVVVHSALAGVSNALEQLVDEAVTNGSSDLLKKIHRTYLTKFFYNLY